jgi:alpha-tubulin suppressor-like RCC1 family protein
VLVPTAVPGLDSVVAVSAGYAHGLALKSDGTVWAWGSNTAGQIGNNASGTNVLTPVQVKTGPSTYLTDVVAIAAGGYFSMALRRDGTVMAWGEDIWGEVGDGTAGGYQLVATPVVGLSGVSGIAAGIFQALALKTDGEASGSVWS